MKVKVENLSKRSLDDRISVCGEDHPDSPSIRRGIEEKKHWLQRMLGEHGPPSKLAYVDSKPVGHIQFYPESSIPYLENPDPKTLHVMCSFVRLALQNKGCGSALFKSLLEDVKREGRFDRIETLGFDPPGCGKDPWDYFCVRLRQRPSNEAFYLRTGEFQERNPDTHLRQVNPRTRDYTDSRGVPLRMSTVYVASETE